ncbi:hypothetical protein RB195_004982 [Necator americanus]|uniref:Protein-tyrosine phosphatase n=1 Tax=Necator americanus TaxID=51031 RepID=A0ABR1BMK6_NECAM
MPFGVRGSQRISKPKQRSNRITSRSVSASKMQMVKSPPSDRVVSISLVPPYADSSSHSIQPECAISSQTSLASPPAKKQSLYQRPATGTATKVTTRISDPSDSDNSSRVKSNRPRKVKDEHERLRVQKESDDTRSSVSSNTSTHNITALTPNDGSVRQSTQEDPNMNLIVQRLREFAWTCEQSTLEQLRNEFDALPKPDLRDCKAFMSPENLRKNRYSNIPCLDSTRVLLNILRPDAGYGYIHANRVEYPTLRNKYIITQGPMNSTILPFWEMIWQENVYCIVMLCQIIEEGKRKCAEYFGSKLEVPVNYGQFNVVLKDQKWDDTNLVTSTLELEYGQESRTITHFHCRDWHDFETPCSQTIISLLQKVRGKSTVVVHCSAGVGRSGTFVALEMCLQDLANGLTINVQQAVVSLRQYRALAVQTFEQYLSIYKAILQMGEKHGAINNKDVQRFNHMYREQVEK